MCIHHDERVAETQVHLHPIGDDGLVIATRNNHYWSTFVILPLTFAIEFDFSSLTPFYFLKDPSHHSSFAPWDFEDLADVSYCPKITFPLLPFR